MSFMFNNSMVKRVEGKCSIKQARVPLLQDFSEPLIGPCAARVYKALSSQAPLTMEPFFPEHLSGLEFGKRWAASQAVPPSPMSALPRLPPPSPSRSTQGGFTLCVPEPCRQPLPDVSQPIPARGPQGPGGLARPRGSAAWGRPGTSGWPSRRCSHSDRLASPVPQSYCLKVKEMDDEEYGCIVSVTG